MQTVHDISNVRGKRVFVRIDLNVPVKQGVVQNDFRIKKALPTIKYLKEKGARIVLASHFKSPETKSLEWVSDYLQDFVPHTFVGDLHSDECRDTVEKLKEGEVVLLENLRKYRGEEANETSFAKYLATLCDLYVNEAFSVSHREHASVVGVPLYRRSYAGLHFEEEVKNLSTAFHPEHPFLFILGGAKFETKIPLVEKFLNKADKVFVGGALANDVFKARGYEVGKSVVSDGKLDLSHILNSEKILLPIDVVTDKGTVLPTEVGKNDVMKDAGVGTVEMLGKEISKARFVLWNGPLGFYEKGHPQATLDLAELIENDSGISIVGGGDTLAAIEELQNHDKYTFVSTGGGAMLDFLAHETLPGIDVLEKRT